MNEIEQLLLESLQRQEIKQQELFSKFSSDSLQEFKELNNHTSQHLESLVKQLQEEIQARKYLSQEVATLSTTIEILKRDLRDSQLLHNNKIESLREALNRSDGLMKGLSQQISQLSELAMQLKGLGT